MSPSTVATTINQKQDKYPSFYDTICIFIAPASKFYFSGTSTDAATEVNPSNPTKFTLVNSYYTVLPIV